jgi:hypothetical protein
MLARLYGEGIPARSMGLLHGNGPVLQFRGVRLQKSDDDLLKAQSGLMFDFF